MKFIDFLNNVDDDGILRIPNERSEDKRVGLIRRVDDAHLVKKTQEADGTYTELWLYSTEGRDPMEIRREIIAGTDIDVEEGASSDGNQHYNIWSPGNCEFLELIGLPS